METHAFLKPANVTANQASEVSNAIDANQVSGDYLKSPKDTKVACRAGALSMEV